MLMTDYTNKDDIKALWNMWIDNDKMLSKEITRVAFIYPSERSVVVDWGDLEHQCLDLADALLKCPRTTLAAGEDVIREHVPLDYEDAKLTLRIRSLPRDKRIEVRNIRAEHQGKFIAVEGLVTRATQVLPRIVEGAWECLRCGRINRVKQDDGAIEEPMECVKDGSMDLFGNGGCGRAAGSTAFKLVSELSESIDSQKLEITEAPEQLRGAQPKDIVCLAEGDIAGYAGPGDRVVLNGTLCSKLKGGGKNSSTMNIYLDVNSVERCDAVVEDIEISPEEEAEFIAMSKRPELYDDLVASICPTIYGMKHEKLAILYMLMGGVGKIMPDGTKIRGESHLLLCGDPGVAKSKLLRYVASIAPRGVYASGKSSSAAGLTAAAVKDEFDEGRWTLQAGAMVIANGGVCCVDELDKMSEQDRSSMHEGMEDGIISIAKAGINAKLGAACAILGAANPKLGRFDPTMISVGDQINLPATLLSRFDLIFTIRDKPNPEIDGNVADHILESHRIGEKAEKARQSYLRPTEIEGSHTPKIAPKMLAKYILYAKRVTPVMTDEAMALLKEYYLCVRMSSNDGRAVPITPRQLEALVRLAEASARTRLSPDVYIEDAERAVEIFKEYMNRVVVNDIDRILTGVSSSQRDQVRALLEIVRSLGADGKGAGSEDIIAAAEKELKMGRGKCQTMLDYMLYKEGLICQPRVGRYAVV
jgi:replicative DNA helicase Mcm